MTIAALFLALIATPADVADAPTPARGEPVLLDFHAQWCGPCKQMRPAIAKLAEAGYPIRSIDVDQQKDLARRYEVTAYPTFLVVDEDGAVLARTEGFQPAADLATLYREAQAKARSRPSARRVSSRRDAEPAPATAATDDEDDEPSPAPRVANPKPWETVVRIRMKMGRGLEGVGSGTVIHSDAQGSLILTCAHIFKEEGGKTPPASRCRMPISVDLFDGQLGGPGKNQVHYAETVRGEAVDYDLTNDVGLIRIRPGRVLPATRVIPAHWKPREKMHMITVGCSEGHDATAWDTHIIRAQAGLRNTGTGETFHVIECANPPKQGRSGGGLFNDDFYIAGVCDFADPQHGNGLYAEPASIYRLLDRNRLTALYAPAPRDPAASKGLVADAGGKPRRPGGTYRGQSPSEGDLTIPAPGLLGIAPPVLAADAAAPRAPSTGHGWRASTAGAVATKPGRRDPAEAVPAEMSREDADELPAVEPAVNTDDLPAPSRSGSATKWRPVRRTATE